MFCRTSIRSTDEKQWLKHLDNQASDHLSLAEEPALLLKILEEFKDIDSDDDLEDTSDSAHCHRKPEKGLELKKCSRCHVTCHCSINCQREGWAFHRFACSVVAKRAATSLTKMKRLLQGCSSVAATMQQSNMYATTGGHKVAN